MKHTSTRFGLVAIIAAVVGVAMAFVVYTTLLLAVIFLVMAAVFLLALRRWKARLRAR